MEDEGRKALKRPCEDLLNSTSAGSKAQVKVKGDCPCEDPSSASSATAASSVEGAKRPCLELGRPSEDDHAPVAAAAAAVMDGMEDDEEDLEFEVELEEEDDEPLWRFEGNQVVVIGERPKIPFKIKMGPPLPHTITSKRLSRRLAEIGKKFLPGDDPFGRDPWNPFPVAEYHPAQNQAP